MTDDAPDFDAAVVGAGFAGLYAIKKLRDLGLAVQCFEAGDDVGGTWYWNRYPGARCDVESVEYSYSFSPELEQEWRWTERYASQPEIQRYLQHVAQRFELRQYIRFGTRVRSAHFDDASGLWRIGTDQGDSVTARYCVMASGCLSEPRLPDIPGLEQFQGRILQTSRWPSEPVDLRGKRVGIIGTGSSGIQAIPEVARDAAQLTVFQRTPAFVVPARNRPLSDADSEHVKQNYAQMRQIQRQSRTTFGFGDPPPIPALSVSASEREQTYSGWWAHGGPRLLFSYSDLIIDAAANETAAQFIRERIAESVQDSTTASTLMPRSYPVGTKRLCQGTDYYETFNCANVELVDLRQTPFERATPTSLQAGGKDYPLDVLICATGFDAVTGALAAVDIRGRGARALSEQWSNGPRMYLGLVAAGFPNLFAITGPGSPSVVTNMVVSIEQHVDYIAGLIAEARQRGKLVVDTTSAAEADWAQRVDEIAHMTLYPRAQSWYMGSNVNGKPRQFLAYLGGMGPYRARCDEIAAQGYPGFTFSEH
jgi:cation diffusion facilitator CzcD-associated flavoprotein CzcO